VDDLRSAFWAAFAGMAKLQLGKDEEAAAWLRRSIEFNRNYSTAHLFLAASLAQRGKLDEARAVTAVGLTFDPTFTITASVALHRGTIPSIWRDASVRRFGYGWGRRKRNARHSAAVARLAAYRRKRCRHISHSAAPARHPF
jgi:hypothetical protein